MRNMISTIYRMIHIYFYVFNCAYQIIVHTYRGEKLYSLKALKQARGVNDQNDLELDKTKKLDK